MNILSKKIRINLGHILIIILVVFNFFFPKGGFKIANIPITWGYLLFYVIVIVNFAKKLTSKFETTMLRWKCMLTILPFQLYTITFFLLNGYEDLGWALSFFLNIVFIPISMVIILGDEIENLDLFYLHKILKYGVLFLCFFGIIHFVYGFLHSGESLEIPYLTVNGGDEDILNTKNNNRGDIYKLISTYNNGNIFGVSLLLILPFYEYIEKSNLIKILLKLTLFLTISRTVWIGLVINELLKIFYVNPKRKNNVKIIISSFFFILVLGLGIFFTGDLFFGEVDFLSPELGGRYNQLEYLTNSSLIVTNPFTEIAEILYLSIIKNFGIVGFIFFIPFLLSPILLNLKTDNPHRRVILISLINYVIIAGSDGAFQYLPVMLFYWFMASLSLRNNISYKSVSNETKAFSN